MVSKLLPAILVAMACSGCVSMQVPSEFLVVNRGLGELKAMTADEAKLWVRHFDDDAKGDLAFWARTLKNDFTQNRGYLLVAEQPITDGAGHQGVELTWETTLGGRPMRELLALFVAPGLFGNTIWVVEMVCAREAYDRLAPEARKAIGTLR